MDGTHSAQFGAATGAVPPTYKKVVATESTFFA